MSRSFGGRSLTTCDADRDGAAGDLLKACDRPQRRGLAASGRTDKHHELALLHLKVQVVEGFHAALVNLVHVIEDDLRHPITPLQMLCVCRVQQASNRPRATAEGLAIACLPADRRLIVLAKRLHREAGAQAMRQLLELRNPPDAVFSCNDLLAAGAIRSLPHGRAPGARGRGCHLIRRP